MAKIHEQQLREQVETIKTLLREIEKKFEQDLDKQIEEKLKAIIDTLKLKYKELTINRTSIPVDQLPEIEPTKELEFISLIHELQGRDMTEVWNGNYKGMEVAIKSRKPGISPARILTEAHTMRCLKHSNIVTLYNTVMSGQVVCIVMEYISSRNLEDYLLVNFSAEQHTSSQELQFPIKWTAPEVLTEKQFCLKSDVWSFGMLVWEVVTGKEPFHGLSVLEASDQITSGTVLPKPDSCTDTFYTIMMHCWKK